MILYVSILQIFTSEETLLSILPEGIYNSPAKETGRARSRILTSCADI